MLKGFFIKFRRVLEELLGIGVLLDLLDAVSLGRSSLEYSGVLTQTSKRRFFLQRVPKKRI